MKKENFLFPGMLVMVLALGLVFVGCGDSDENVFVWNHVSSIDQLNGTWIATYEKTVPYKQARIHWDGEDFWTSDDQVYFGEMNLKFKEEHIWTINVNAKTESWTEKRTETYFGGNIDILWGRDIRYWWEDDDDATVNNDNRSVTFIHSEGPYPMYDDDDGFWGDWFLINKAGNKIKRPDKQEIFGEYFDRIFTKQ